MYGNKMQKTVKIMCLILAILMIGSVVISGIIAFLG
jgi:ABC-type Fe3+-siderophore transport system permease subunit